MSDHDIIIIGGGIAGLACAVGLIRQGVRNIKIYEKAKSIKPIGAALCIYPNGERAIKELSPSVYTKVKRSIISGQHDIIKDATNGETLRKINLRDVKRQECCLPQILVRHLLQNYLLEELPEGVISLGREFHSHSIDETTGLVTVRVANRRSHHEFETTTCRVLVGADGLRSAVRTQLFGKRLLYYHERMMFQAVMTISSLAEPRSTCPPAGTTVTYQNDEKGKIFSFRRCSDEFLTMKCSVTMDVPSWSKTKADRKRRLQRSFAAFPSDCQDILKTVCGSAIYEDGVYSVNVEEAWSHGPVVILGDAAHAMTTGLEQGANQGLEDACELVLKLAPMFRQYHTDDDVDTTLFQKTTIPETLEKFWHERIDRVREIHELSDKNTNRGNFSNVKNLSSCTPKLNPTFFKRLYGWKPSSHFCVDGEVEVNSDDDGFWGKLIHRWNDYALMA